MDIKPKASPPINTVKANPTSKEQLIAIIAEMHNDIKWIKKEIEEMKRESKEAMDSFKEEVEERLDEIDSRVSKLESFKWRIIGGVTVGWAILLAIIQMAK